MLMLARMVRMLTMAIVAVIVVGIVLHVLDANAGNAFVSAIHDVAGWFVAPFKGIFSFKDNDLQIAVNWGLAALVYAIVGGLISSLLARAALAGEERRGWRNRRAAY
jgi:FtsH-binding integral membrane protein